MKGGYGEGRSALFPQKLQVPILSRKIMAQEPAAYRFLNQNTNSIAHQLYCDDD